MKQQILTYYQQLSEREQRLLGVSTIVVVIGLFYWLVWAPLDKALVTQRDLVEQRQEDLAWLTKQANRAIQLRKSAGQAAGFTGSLPQVVNQTASRRAVSLTRMQPLDDELKVWVDQADFNAVLNWLEDLEQRGVRIIDIDLAKGNAAGQIKIRNLQLGKS